MDDGIIGTGTSVLDFGCGRGGDVRTLRNAGIVCSGWDPVYYPDGERKSADVVNLGYVINVIEDPQERAEVLREAWSLARRALIVSARLAHEVKSGRLASFGDGCVTSKNTFQKFYRQEELRDWLEEIIGNPTIAGAPGIFYVFREEADRQAFIAREITRRHPAGVRRPPLKDLLESHRDMLGPVIDFVLEHARAPETDEVLLPEAVWSAFGSMRRLCRAVMAEIGQDEWFRIRAARSEDLLVYIALSRLSHRPKFGMLPAGLQRDIRALFGSYSSACTTADDLLFSAGNMPLVRKACMGSSFGKLTHTALYVHVVGLERLSPILRIYEGCARSIVGSIEGATLVKFRFDEPIVSYLSYPKFDTDPHPAIAGAVTVPLQTFRVAFRDYSGYGNPPILHRKELFVPLDYPGRVKFARLTKQEERFGLLAMPELIGTRHGWEERLSEHGVRLMGHRVVRNHA